MRGSLDIRKIEDIDSAAPPPPNAKAIASGNPLMLEKSIARTTTRTCNASNAPTPATSPCCTTPSPAPQRSSTTPSATSQRSPQHSPTSGGPLPASLFGHRGRRRSRRPTGRAIRTSNTSPTTPTLDDSVPSQGSRSELRGPCTSPREPQLRAPPRPDPLNRRPHTTPRATAPPPPRNTHQRNPPRAGNSRRTNSAHRRPLVPRKHGARRHEIVAPSSLN